jgi:hypothetical protein
MVEKEVFKIPHDGRPVLSERMSKGLIGVVHRAVGLASMCWSNIDGAGTFNAKEAEDIAVELCYTIADEIEAERDATCGYIESTITRRDAHVDKALEHLKRARELMSTYPEV